MGVDIQYLLWLQELRNATGGIFDEFFNALSKFAVDIMPFLPFVIFWGVDKKWGYENYCLKEMTKLTHDGSDVHPVIKRREPKYMRTQYCFGSLYIVPNVELKRG